MKTMLDVVGAVKTYTDSKVSLDPKEITVDYSDIISITDAFPKEAKDVRLKVEPVQDLHGYNNPWVGGAGKNKLDFTVSSLKALNTNGTWSDNVYTYGNVTFTVLVDNANNVTGIKVNGTSNGTVTFFLVKYEDVSCPYNGYVLNGCPSGGSTSTYYLRISDNIITSNSDVGDGVTIAINDTGRWNCFIEMKNNVTISNLVYYPMIRTASESASYESPTNICPITGWDNAKVTRAGINLASTSITTKFNSNGTVQSISGTKSFEGYIGGSSGNVKITVTAYGGNRFVLAATKQSLNDYDAGTYIGYIINHDRSGDEITKYSYTCEVPTNRYISVYVANNSYSGDVSVQIELGETATAYEPNNSEEITISLGGTRYGGTLDVTSGVLTVLDDCSEYDGSNDESWTTRTTDSGWTLFEIDISEVTISSYTAIGLCNMFSWDNTLSDNFTYRIQTHTLAVRCDGMTMEAFKAMLSTTPLQIVYPLATPQTIRLTPTEVKLLLGYNTLFADTGDISLTYDLATFGNVLEEVGELEDDVQDLTNEVRGNWATGGVNLFNGKFTVGYNISNTGDIVSNSKCAYTTDLIEVTGNKVTVSFKKAVYSVYISEYGSNDNFIRRDASSTNVATFTTTLNDNCKKIRVAFNYNDSTTVTNEIANSINTQIELGDTATPYQPYAPTNLQLENNKADKSDLASISITGTTNSTGATITSGRYFYLNGTLVKAKTSIANGATLTANTNYEEVTAGGLNDLVGRFNSKTVVFNETNAKGSYAIVQIGKFTTIDFQIEVINVAGTMLPADTLPRPYGNAPFVLREEENGTYHNMFVEYNGKLNAQNSNIIAGNHYQGSVSYVSG